MRGDGAAIRVHPRDNVAVAQRPLSAGETVRVGAVPLVVREAVPAGHKVALDPIPPGGLVIKYGFPIGRATAAVERGAWVHEHNLHSALSGAADYAYEPSWNAVAPVDDGRTFEGFVRPGGAVGVRNEIWVIPTVGCVNDAACELARAAGEGPLPQGVDGVFAFPHPQGCSQLGDDHRRTQRILAGLVRHPNAAAVLVLGLGCENNTMASFREVVGEVDEQRVRFLVAQEVSDEMESGLRALKELTEIARAARREPVPVSRLRVGLKCGGSDAFSGLTANPLVGAVSDMLVARGAAAVLTEVPEMFGAETILLNRSATRASFEQGVRMINGFKDYYARHGEPVDENPSPGNRAGGITTLEEKSLGCVQKGGTSPVAAVLDYGDTLKDSGLHLLAGPGNDMVAVTALAAAGAQATLFTTGRGTPLGGPVPTIKISSTSALCAAKGRWIDFDAGPLLSGAPLSSLAERLFEHLLDVASGRARTRSEAQGCRAIAIWKDGVTL